MKPGVTMTVDRLGNVVKNVRALTSTDVLVGIPEAKTQHNPQHGQKDGITNAAIGYINEFGSPAANIPARPHLIPGIDAVKDALAVELGKAGEAALKGDIIDMETRLNRAGSRAQTSVKKTINAGVPPPLAPRTLESRKRLGRKGTKPLVDTKEYRNSITYVIRKGKRP